MMPRRRRDGTLVNCHGKVIGRAPDKQPPVSQPVDFDKTLAGATAALGVIGTGKLRDGPLVREGARAYVSQPGGSGGEGTRGEPGPDDRMWRRCQRIAASMVRFFEIDPATWDAERAEAWHLDVVEMCMSITGKAGEGPDATIATLRRERDEARDRLRKLANGDDDHGCAECGWFRFVEGRPDGSHAPSCELGAFLSRLDTKEGSRGNG